METTEKIIYPYLPEGREILFVPLDNEFMQVARKNCNERSGCSWWPTSAVVVKDGKIIGEGINEGNFVPVCPRWEQKCPTGTGYHLCKDICQQKGVYGHGEYQAMENAIARGLDPVGADVYLFGHWWCCQPCWDRMIAGGIRHVYLPENAHLLFHPDKRKALMQNFVEKIARGETVTRSDAIWQV